MSFDDLKVNLTAPGSEPEWNSAPAWKLPGWAEPILVLSILIATMVATRRKGISIFKSNSNGNYGLLNSDPDGDSARSSDDLLARERMLRQDSDDSLSFDSMTTMKNPPKKRRCCGMIVYTPNTSRFADYPHSRILQKFPFLIEMFYWVLTFGVYHSTKAMSRAYFKDSNIWEVAQEHGLSILAFEQFSWASFLFPFKEYEVQQWFMHGHQDLLTVLNRAYALIHIPGTVGFIGWYYYVAPSFKTFAIVRRTMTLTNLLAFTIFVLFPTMPPRLLPKEYGFLDSVRHDDAQSVWMSGQFVNALAAMPSMHFGYSFCIGVTLIHYSGAFRSKLEPGEGRKTFWWKLFYVVLGVGYPTFLLVTIVATANHYVLDAMVATIVAITAYICNRIFLCLLPLEDLLLWCLRLDKPVPSTGDRHRGR